MTVDPTALFYELGGRNAEIESHPIQRKYTYDVKGMVLRLPRSDLVVVPFEMHGDGSWGCVVVVGNETYPRGGYDLWVPENEIQRAIEVVVE